MQPRRVRRPTFWDVAYRHGDHLDHWASDDGSGVLDGIAAEDRPLRGAAVLDLGCGAGAESVFLAGEGYEVVGVDSSPVALDLARRRAEGAGVEVGWCAGDACRLPLPDSSVEMVVDRGCFHVISRRRRHGYAREAARVLRPGGSLLLRVAREDDEEAGVLGVDEPELRGLFAPVGFRFGEIEAEVLRSRAGDLAVWRIHLRLPSTRGRTTR